MQLIATCTDICQHQVDEKQDPLCVWLGLAQPPQVQGNAGNTDQGNTPDIAQLLRCFSAQAADVDLCFEIILLHQKIVSIKVEKYWD